MKKPILDACCGSRMFWFDKDNPFTEFMDIRDEECVLSDGQLCMVHPNTIGDFTCMPFDDDSFKLCVFDPPHLVKAGISSNMYKMYGRLENNWREVLTKGFQECFRVLQDYGVLIFKWSEIDIKLTTILHLVDRKPLFGHRRGKTIWVCFMKFPNN